MNDRYLRVAYFILFFFNLLVAFYFLFNNMMEMLLAYAASSALAVVIYASMEPRRRDALNYIFEIIESCEEMEVSHMRQESILDRILEIVDPPSGQGRRR